MADDNKGVTITDSRSQTRGNLMGNAADPAAPAPAPAAADQQQDERSKQKVRVKAIAAFNGPDGFKNHDSEPFDAPRDWAVQARAQGIIEYVNEDDYAKEVEQSAKAASDKAREAANRRKPGATLADEHKSPTPLKQPAIKTTSE